MSCEIEWLAGVMRLGREFQKHGDPYEFMCGVVRSGDTISFIGASSQAVASLVRERENIRAMLRPLGIKRVRWSRMKDGVELWREYPV
ncbi:MAG: hypothetical protein WC343_01585 [Bacilli bacterium]|jgi:hypothetical protein